MSSKFCGAKQFGWIVNGKTIKAYTCCCILGGSVVHDGVYDLKMWFKLEKVKNLACFPFKTPTPEKLEEHAILFKGNFYLCMNWSYKSLANQLTGFYMKATLALNGLIVLEKRISCCFKFNYF